jgi:hypothetical protein
MRIHIAGAVACGVFSLCLCAAAVAQGMPGAMQGQDFGGPPPNVRKITDGALTCEQILAESRQLEQSAATHQAAADNAQREAAQAQDLMMKQAMGARGGGMSSAATGLLGMLPGVGFIGGIAAQSAAESRMASMQQQTAVVTQVYERMAQSHQALQFAQARNDHLVGLFLQKGCKVPEGAAAAASR